LNKHKSLTKAEDFY